MDFLKGQLDKIQQQLGGLNASQKMLTGSLVAIMVMTLLWWGRYAGTAEMEPVLPEAIGAGDVARVNNHFKSVGIPSTIQGDKILVPADRRDEAIASLAFNEILPENSASAFDEISKQLNSFMPQGTTDALFKEAKQRTLQNVIRKFPGVKEAVVLLTPAGDRKMRMANEASASVHIMMKDGGNGTRKLAESAAVLIAGAQEHLPVKNLSVVIGVRPYRITDPRDGIGDTSEIGEARASHERYFETKVRELYPDIEGLFVNVSVNLNTTTSQIQSTTHENVQQKEKRTNSRTETEPVPGPPAAEPGALSNTGASIDQVAAAPAYAGERSTDQNETDFEIIKDVKTANETKPAGDFSAISAALRVPRSYFVKAYKAFAASTADPAPAQLQSLIDAEMEKMRSAVVVSTAIEDEAKVIVTMYEDSPGPLRTAANALPPSTVTLTLGHYSKEIAIGALAMISLFMVSMMVRRSTPAPVIAAAPAPRETPHLDGMSEIAGIVGNTNQLLDGMELDEDAVRTQQMLDQVQTMVGENPDAAANLVKRWLNRT